MSLRLGLRASLLAVASLVVIAVTPVAAKPTVSVTIQETSACHFSAFYLWSGMGHGSELTAWIGLVAVDGGGESVILWSSSGPEPGRYGSSSNDFVSTESAQYQYKAIAYLQTSRGTIIARSQATSLLAPSAPETCS